MTASPARELETASRSEDTLPEDIRWATGSALLGLFAVALFDQAALPEVSFALDKTGRIRNDPFGRAGRTAASHQIITWGDGEDRRAEAERLKTLHQAVRGAMPEGHPYSALSPDLWKFIQASSIMMIRNSVAVLIGRDLTGEEDQALYDYSLTEIGVLLELGPSSQLPTLWPDFVDWYEMMTDRLEPTETLHDALAHVRRAPAPDLLPAPLRLAWPLARPVLGHVLLVLGTGVLHPQAREAMQLRWGWAEQTHFKLLSRGVGIACRHLPKRVTLSPLAYNRYQYERLISQYQAVGLQSFAPNVSPTQ
jgi:uncharacterized protein (DUF2236 family)